MKDDSIRKNENEKEVSWDARMNAIEKLWRAKMAENRLEYKDFFSQVKQNRLKSAELHKN
ncbi:MAG: hypothetical protein JXB03_03185 [Spirochaetales bacterium]|nr:hypothetical protein [Spirochaetales bacterium]